MAAENIQLSTLCVGYVSTYGSQTTSSGPTAITGLTKEITVPTGVTKLLVMMVVPGVGNSESSASNTQVSLYKDGNAVAQQNITSLSNYAYTASLIYVDSVTAGAEHTYAGYFQNVGGTNAEVMSLNESTNAAYILIQAIG